MLTTDPIYWKSFQPKIEIKNLGNTTTYYTFDAFADVTTNKVVYCRVDLGLDHHGTFEIQIENSNLGLDTTNIKKGQRVIISVKKDTTLSYNRLISGLIRKTGYTRGVGGQALYTIQGSSTAIRLNEIITNQDHEARKLAQDGITIDVTDPSFKADVLLQAEIGGFLSSDGVISATNLPTFSDVENFIPSIQVNFGELQDVVNIVEEHTNAECFVDTNDIVQLTHQLQPFTTGRGFVLKDTVGTADDADITCYYDGAPEYWESCFKSDSYSNQLWGILSAETVPSSKEDMGIAGPKIGNFTQTGLAQEWAQKFKPTHSHFFPGDIIIAGLEMIGGGGGTSIPWITRFRIAGPDVSNTPNSLPVIININFPDVSFPNPIPLNVSTSVLADNGILILSDQTFFGPTNIKLDSFDLDTTKNYWLISSNDNVPASHAFAWPYRLFTGGNGMFANTGASTDASAGTGWTFTISGSVSGFAMPRRRSQAFECADHKGIGAVGSGLGTTGGNHISSTLSNIPSSVTTREAIQKYLANQQYFMARPQVTWPTFRVSVPNLPILPNDPLMIVDSTLLFSTSGTQAVTATTGSMSYEFGSRGGQGNSMQSSLYLNITPVGFKTGY